MRKISLVLLLIIFITSCFLFGTMLSETVRCRSLEQEYPDYAWRVIFVRCYADVNGRWLDADRFQYSGMSP